MTDTELILTLLVIVLFLCLLFRSRRRKDARPQETISKQQIDLLSLRADNLAKSFLLHVIPGEKIRYVPRPLVTTGITNSSIPEVQGLVASGLDSEELRMVSYIDSLLGHRIISVRNDVQLPGIPTNAEIERFSHRF